LNSFGNPHHQQVYSKIEYSHKLGLKDILIGLGMNQK
jgi:hypothetical protein